MGVAQDLGGPLLGRSAAHACCSSGMVQKRAAKRRSPAASHGRIGQSWWRDGR